jgi:hypothetical protein
MRSTALYYAASMLLVGVILAVGMVWTHWSHLHRHQGQILMTLTSEHGVHTFDLVVLGLELTLLSLLSIVLISGFSRGR